MSLLRHLISWELPVTLLGAVLLVHAFAQSVHAISAAINRAGRVRDRKRGLRRAIILLGAFLAPVFFADMFATVTRLLGPAFHSWAWTVPAASEGSFVFLYLLDLYLMSMGKPMGWLRYAPYPFAAASLFLNVYSSRGDIPAMTGHAVVTVAFFLPLLAGEAAFRSLSASGEAVALAVEMQSARRYALDLIRDQKGPLWWLRPSVPSLLRARIRHARFPAAVATAVKDGAAFGGSSKWEVPVEQMVTDALTQHARMSASLRRQEQQIADAHGAAPRARRRAKSPDRTSVPAPGTVAAEPAEPPRQDRAMPLAAGTVPPGHASTAPRHATDTVPAMPAGMAGGPRPLKPGAHPDPVAIEAARDEWHAAFAKGQIHNDRTLAAAVNDRFGYKVIGRTSAGSVIAAEREQRRTG